MMNDNSVRYAYVHRLIAPDHVCPLGRKSVNLLKRKGYTVVDRPLRDSVEEDAFKAQLTALGEYPAELGFSY